MKVEWKLEGAKEMEALLKKLGPAVASKVVRSATRAGAQVVAAEAKRLVPVRTGELGAAITVVQVGEDDVNLRAESRVGFFKPTSRRAHLTEFGTAKAAAKPFLRPALDAKAGEAIQEMAKVTGKGIAREARKLAGPVKRARP